MKTILSLLLLFTLHTATAQSWQWGTSGGSSFNTGTTNSETIIDMATDANGNIYALTEVSGGNPITIGNQTINTYGYKDILVFSYNCNGQFRWAKCIGTPNGNDAAIAVAVDGQSNVYVTGRLLNFNPTTQYFDADSIQQNPLKTRFLIKYDSSGNYQWLRQYGSDTIPYLNQDYYSVNKVNDMVGDPAGGVYMLGYMPAGLLAGGDGIVVPAYGMYMLHYNAQGNITELTPMDMEIFNLQQSIFVTMRMVRTSSGKIIICGKLAGLLPYNNVSMGGQLVTHPMFIGCFNTNGSLAWKKENTTTTLAGAFVFRPVINNSQIILGGGTANDDSFAGYQFINTVSTIIRGFPLVVVLDTLGNLVWAKNASAYADGSGSAGVAIVNNKVITGGDYTRLLWDTYQLYITTNSGNKIFAAELDLQTGAVLKVDSLQGTFGSNHRGTVLKSDNKGNVYIGGNMNSQMYVNGQTLTSNGGDNDFFIAKYGSADCSSVVPVNITYFNAALQNKAVYLQWQTANEINVSHFNIQRSINGTEFTTIGKTNAMGNGNNSYNYTDNDAVSVIPPLGVRGLYYRLQNIDKDGSYTYSKIENIQLPTFNTQLSIYPNPTRNIVNVVSKNIQQINIIDFTGRILIQQNFNNANNVKLNIANLSKGIYLLKVVDIKGNVQTKKLIVE